MSTTPLTCAICGHTEAHWLGDHIVDAHRVSIDSYIDSHTAQHPGLALASDDLTGRYKASKGNVRRAHPPATRELTVTFKGIEFVVHAGVDPSACLPMPDKYQLPRHGELGKDIANTLVSLLRGRSIYIWGLPGTGKDALFHAWSHQTRTPAIIKQVIPGTDIEAWFFSRGFNQEGTSWEEGDVLRALRDGYLCKDGARVPYMLLVSDLDRADRTQAEYLRLITDSIRGRVSGPTGKVYNLLPGTRVVATANTPGGGDSRGRMVSANPLDASILDRFERKYEFHWMDWKDEGPIVEAKFPLLLERAPQVFQQMGGATVALRKAIRANELYAEFSHRGLCSILGHAEDLLFCSGRQRVPGNLLNKASRCWLDGLPDDETRKAAVKLMAPHVRGGMGNPGDISHQGGNPLADI